MKKKQVSYGKFSRMEWMRQQGLYKRCFLNSINHKEGERNGSMFCKMLDHLINKGGMEALCERRTNMDAHKKLLESTRRGIQMMRYLRHEAS